MSASQSLLRPLRSRAFVCHTASGELRRIAGSATHGFADGIGPNAAFKAAMDFRVLRDGSAVLVADHNSHCIRHVNTVTRAVTTVAGCGEAADRDGPALTAALMKPAYLAFDVTSLIPESVVYVTTDSCLRRFARTTSK